MKELNKQRQDYLTWDEYFMSIAMISSKEVSQIIAHSIVLLILVAGGYGICKTAKAIKAEGGK